MKEYKSFMAVLHKYLPFWPLFLVLVAACCAGAWAYIRMQVPRYEASATLLIREGNQSNAAQGLEGFNLLPGNKNVENEIEVIRSRGLMREVVTALHLYAPVFEEGDVKTLPAYTSSPIIVKVKEPQKIKALDKVYFTYNKNSNGVVIDKQTYALDQWIKMPYGEVMFSRNDKLEQLTKNPVYFKLLPLKAAANGLRGGINISPINRNSSVIVLKFQDDVPRRAEDIINELTVAYTKASIMDKSALTANTLSFVEDRIRYVENELDSLENKIRSYKSQKGIVDLGSQGKMFLDNLSANDQEIANINTKLTVLNQVERYVQTKNRTAGIVPATLGVSDPMLNGLLEKLYETETRYEQLRKTVPESNPMAMALKSQIERIKPGLIENIRSQKQSLSASMGNINSTTRSYSSMLRAIPQKEKELLDFTRQQAIKNSVYTFLLQKREETALANSSTVPDNRVVDAAEASMIPNSPSKSVIYMLAVVLGLLAGMGVVTAKELLNTKFLFRAEVESATTAPVVSELSLLKDAAPLVTDRQKHMLLFEQFRQLRVAIGLFGKVRTRRKVMITSSIPGEGKSFVSSNLALSLSMAGKKVALIDLDIRNPNTTALFELKNEKGVADFLDGDFEPFEIVRQSKFDNLAIIPAGSGDVINTVELLMNGKLEMLLHALSENFDHIIIDTSPVELVSDAYVLSEYCDTTLFVVRHGYTPQAMLQISQESKKIKRLKNVAVVFNGVKPRGFLKKGYGYGYGYGYEKMQKNSTRQGPVTVS